MSHCMYVGSVAAGLCMNRWSMEHMGWVLVYVLIGGIGAWLIYGLCIG